MCCIGSPTFEEKIGLRRGCYPRRSRAYIVIELPELNYRVSLMRSSRTRSNIHTIVPSTNHKYLRILVMVSNEIKRVLENHIL